MLLTKSKRFLGRVLYGLAAVLPPARPWLAGWGLRTKPEWFPGYTPRARSRVTGQRLRLPSFGENYLSFELFWRGLDYYEPLSASLIATLTDSTKLFVDAGANIGAHSLRLAAARPDMEIIAFEPNPKLHALLKANIRANGFRNITAEPFALSDAEGIRPLYLSQSDMSASLDHGFEPNHAGIVSVPVDTLDRYLDGRGAPDRRFVLKVDVEGLEAAFFAGAANTIRRCRPDIIAEAAAPYPAATIELLYRCGYRFRQITDEGLLPCVVPAARVRGPFVFLNCLLTTRPSAELEGISADLRAFARRLDLNQTSKRADRRVVARCQSRGGAGSAVSRSPSLGALPGPWPGPQTR
jgi:FkbM family methyltransferase